MNSEEEEHQEEEHQIVEIPEDSIVVRPSSWAWMWPAVPWVVLASASLLIDLFSFGTLPIFFAVIIVLPRYMTWRNTLYILTNEYLVVQKGRKRKQRFDLPISQIVDIQTRPGLFGRSLGYASVLLMSKEGGVATLPYIPAGSPLVGHILTRMGDPPPPEGEDQG